MEKSVKLLPTYANKVNLAPDPFPTSDLQNPTKKIDRDMKNILIVSENDKFKDSVEVKQAFAKDFPMKMLVVDFNTARCNIHLEILSSEEADEVLNSWRPFYFRTKTTIREAGERSDRRSAVIKHVPSELQDE